DRTRMTEDVPDLRADPLDQYFVVDLLAAVTPPRFSLFKLAAHLVPCAPRESASILSRQPSTAQDFVADQCPPPCAAARIQQIHQPNARDGTGSKQRDTTEIRWLFVMRSRFVPFIVHSIHSQRPPRCCDGQNKSEGWVENFERSAITE